MFTLIIQNIFIFNNYFSALSNDIDNVKDDFSITTDKFIKDNNYNLILDSNPTSRAHNGLTYTFDTTDKCNVSGTSTGGSYCDIFANANRIPEYIAPGNKYYVAIKSDKVTLRIIFAYNGVFENKVSVSTKTHEEFTIPSNISGLRIQLLGANSANVLVNETVEYKLFVANDDWEKGILRDISGAANSDDVDAYISH